MRALLAAAAASTLILAAGGAQAQAANVTVSVGAELQSKASKIGERDIDYLREELSQDVSRALTKIGAQRADLVLEMAAPTRPTFRQVSNRPGLSMRSIGLGGAAVTGTVTLADGTVQPVSYRWYENDLRNAFGMTTWSDAHRAFDLLANQVAHGKIPNQGPQRAGDRDFGLFGARYY